MRKTAQDKADAFVGKLVVYKPTNALIGEVTDANETYLLVDNVQNFYMRDLKMWSGSRKQIEATARIFLQKAFYKFISAGKCVKVSDTHISKSITFEMSNRECTLAKIYIQDKLGVPFKDYNEDGFETFWEFGNMQRIQIVEEPDALPTISLIQFNFNPTV